jgi:hypothetical protein
MPHVPKTRVVPERPNILRVLLAFLTVSVIALAVAQALSNSSKSTPHRDYSAPAHCGPTCLT